MYYNCGMSNNEMYKTLGELKGKRLGGTIENWKFISVGEPMQGTGQQCYGRIEGDDRFGDGGGDTFRTSEIIRHYEEDKILETRNTFYQLGAPYVKPPPLTDKEQKELDEAVKLLSNFV